MEQNVKSWIHNNSALFGKMLSLAFLVFGIVVIIGAIRNWDWIYKPDESYQNRWTIGQISKYLGRGTARILGAIGGLIIIFAGVVWSYKAFTKN